MRLGQLARKYGVSLNEVISYLKEIDPDSHKIGRNSKLDEGLISKVAEHFANLDNLGEDDAGSEYGPDSGQITQLPESDSTEVMVEDQNPEPEPVVIEAEDAPAEEEAPRPAPVAIETDKLLEMLESEEEPKDLDKITLIKAPKRELDGLKVVGKIELPEPKIPTKETKKPEEESKQTRGRHQSRQSGQLSEAEREKRRLKAKRKKEAYEAREEKRQKQREKKQKKAQNRARYLQKMERKKLSKVKIKQKIEVDESVQTPVTPAPPRTWLGKLWRWLTTY